MRFPRITLIVCVLALTAGTAFAQVGQPPPTTDDCLACHSDAELKRANGTSLAVSSATFAASIHGGLACVDCHADLSTSELPHPEKLQKVSCAMCHDEPVAAFNRSIHHELQGKQGITAPTCATCHGTHDILPSKDAASRTYALNLPRTCAECHGGNHLVGPKGEVAESYADSVHGRAIAKSGLLVAANCSSCHGAHDIRRKNDQASPVHRTNVAATCAKCHEGIQKDYEKSVHAQQISHGNTGAAVCSDCHTSHRIQRHETEAWRLAVIDECGTCHVERISTYRDTYHGKVTELGFTRVAACADCHGNHEILAASNPASMVSPQNLVTTCRQCHANANENFTKYDPHANKKDPTRSPLLYWSYRFMQLLLAGVFVFYGAHTLLWFPRSIKARRDRNIRRRNGKGDAA
jgi:nitrate/TMAO reductase-like tetraheme cytochrome c subunit